MERTIVAVTGTIGSGKDTISEVFKEKFGFYQLSFGKILKDTVAVLFGWDRALLEGDTEESREWRNKIDPFWSTRLDMKITPRFILQHFGTNIVRTHFNTDIWVHCLEKTMVDLPHNVDKIIISDCRFINELALVQKYNGTMIEVIRKKPDWYDIAYQFNISGNTNIPEELKDVHISEWGWIGLNNPDYVFHNTSTIENVQKEVYLTFKDVF